MSPSCISGQPHVTKASLDSITIGHLSRERGIQAHLTLDQNDEKSESKFMQISSNFHIPRPTLQSWMSKFYHGKNQRISTHVAGSGTAKQRKHPPPPGSGALQPGVSVYGWWLQWFLHHELPAPAVDPCHVHELSTLRTPISALDGTWPTKTDTSETCGTEQSLLSLMSYNQPPISSPSESKPSTPKALYNFYTCSPEASTFSEHIPGNPGSPARGAAVE